jgi:hypothetical protein
MKTQTLFEASAPAPVRASSVSKAVADHMAKLGEFRILTLRETPAYGKAENPEHSADYWRKHVATDPRHNPDVETLICLVLNVRRDILGHFVVATGLLDTLLCHPREVYRPAIIANASAIVVMHCHPNGDRPNATIRRHRIAAFKPIALRAPRGGQARGQGRPGAGEAVPDRIIRVRGKACGNLLVVFRQDGGQHRQFAGDAFDQPRLGGDHGRVGG